MHLFFHQQMAAAQGDGWAETDAMLCILLLHCRRAAHGATLHHWRWRGLLTDYLAVQGAPAGSSRPAILLCHGFGAFSGERAGISAGLPWRGVLCLLLSRLGSVFSAIALAPIFPWASGSFRGPAWWQVHIITITWPAAGVDLFRLTAAARTMAVGTPHLPPTYLIHPPPIAHPAAEHYRGNVAALAAAGYDVYAPTLPGYGRAEKPVLPYGQVCWGTTREYVGCTIEQSEFAGLFYSVLPGAQPCPRLATTLSCFFFFRSCNTGPVARLLG